MYSASRSADGVWVAAGRYDGYWERGLHTWDIAAGVLIAKEGGALVEALGGDDAVHETGALIAAAEPIFDNFANVIRNT